MNQIICYWNIAGAPETRVVNIFRIFNKWTMLYKLLSIASENHYHFSTIIWHIYQRIFSITLGWNDSPPDFKLLDPTLRYGSRNPDYTQAYLCKNFHSQNSVSATPQIKCPVKIDCFWIDSTQIFYLKVQFQSAASHNGHLIPIQSFCREAFGCRPTSHYYWTIHCYSFKVYYLPS